MLRPLSAATACLIALSVVTAFPSPAVAAGGVKCNSEGNCQVVVENPGSTGTSNGGSNGGGNGGGAGPVSTGNGGGSQQEVLTPEEVCAATQPKVNGQTVGTCGVTAVGNTAPGTPPAPGAPAPPAVTAAQVAQQAVSQLQIRRPKIGSAPCTTAGCKGTVGVPVWVWTEPWRPLTATATAGPFTITATAKVAMVQWNLGEGATFNCYDAGTEYKIAYGFSTPKCGRASGYQRAGTYQIGATYQWEISWTGAATGSTTMQTRSSTPAFPVSEYQAVVTHH